MIPTHGGLYEPIDVKAVYLAGASLVSPFPSARVR
jgi:hypothetical protein